MAVAAGMCPAALSASVPRLGARAKCPFPGRGRASLLTLRSSPSVQLSWPLKKRGGAASASHVKLPGRKLDEEEEEDDGPLRGLVNDTPYPWKRVMLKLSGEALAGEHVRGGGGGNAPAEPLPFLAARRDALDGLGVFKG